ncbi:MAG: thiaminase II [Actinomycetota bacterium]|nr:thiaminase II [Actinomycetota bacterium]
MEDALSRRLWASAEGTYKQILDHPFIRGLTDASLGQDAFSFYVVQDALYLPEFARALSICAAKAPADADIQMFCEHAAGAIAVERQLHEGFFEDLGLSEQQVRATPMSPTNLAYTSYLLASCYGGSFQEALGAVLPCYWIYWEVGKALIARGSPDPLYRRWIETYGGEEFAEIVRAVLTLTDRVGQDLSREQEARVEQRFITSSRYEWMFWDMGYRRERWPL